MLKAVRNVPTKARMADFARWGMAVATGLGVEPADFLDALDENSRMVRDEDKDMTRAEVQRFSSWLGRRSYQVRLKRFGIERIRAIARENGKKGGRPPGSVKRRLKRIGGEA